MNHLDVINKYILESVKSGKMNKQLAGKALSFINGSRISGRLSILINEIGYEIYGTHRNYTFEEIMNHVSFDVFLDKLMKKPDTVSSRSIYPPIVRVEECASYPLSSPQTRIFYANMLDETGISYNIPQIIRLEKHINPEKIEEIIKALIKRHELLRTSIRLENGVPVQVVHKEVNFKLEYANIASKDLKDAIKSLIKPFDLTAAPLFRGTVLSQSDGSMVLLLDIHHIIADGYSLSNILAKELSALMHGETLPELKLQYKDYAVWQRKLLDNGYFKKMKNYWQEVFSGEIPLLNMPLDYPRPPVASFKGDYILFRANKELTEKLKQISAQNGATLYMTLLASYNILLARYTGQEDIVVGVMTMGRSHKDTENMFGMFVNTIPLRSYPKGDKTFGELLREVRTNIIAAFENEDFQYDELVKALDLKRDMSRTPLFDTAFFMQNHIISENNLTTRLEMKTSQFEIKIEGLETNDGILFSLEYNVSLFKKETMERMSRHFINILIQVSEQGKKRLNAFDMLSHSEKEQLLESFNLTKTEYPRDKTIHALFEEQVQRIPEAIAAVFEEKTLTYSELNRKADCLANLLRKRGVEPETIVGIMVNRSLDMLVGIMGILKAGGAYLPIDPQYPQDRINYMLEDSKAKILLTQRAISVNAGYDTERIYLDDEDIYKTEGENTVNTVRPDNLAYIIYTSGSTGKPKGVMIEHRSVVNFIKGMQACIGFKEGENILCLTSVSFDIFGLETLMPLAFGMKITIADEETQENAMKLSNLLKKEEINILQITPSRMKLLMTYEGALCGLSELRAILFGGEVLPEPLLRAVQSVSGARLFNMYGPTETTIWSTVKEVTKESSVTIGKPIANTRIYICGHDQCIQPVGIPGELYIGGEGLARGYMNNPELTLSKFVENPFRAGERVYRTGDLAKWLPDGEIEFLGRIDNQVKVRGYRIELDEIESRLSNHEAVKEAVAAVREDSSGNQYICAYIVPDKEAPVQKKLTVSELRTYLKRELPEYMIPSHFIELEKMPLNANGKVDHKALSGLEGHLAAGNAYQAPRNALEQKLVDLWQDELKVEPIGIDDNFFELGGHSLKATVMLAKVHKETNVEVPVRILFSKPTIRELSYYISRQAQEKYYGIPKSEEQECYPVSSAQKRLYALQQLDVESTGYNMLTAFELKGQLERTHVEKVFNELIIRHESLRTSFFLESNEEEEEIKQVVHKEVEFAVEYSEIEDDTAAGEYIESFMRPFDLHKAPLMRVGLVKVQPEKNILLVDIHHIIADGTSIGILIKEFSRLYMGETLLPPMLQYKDYAVWQKKRQMSEDIIRQEAFWLSEYAGKDKGNGSIPVLNLPTDFKRPLFQSFEGGRIDVEFPPGLVDRLNVLAQDTGATLFMVLLAGLNILLSKYSGQEDIVIGSPIAGRPYGELENIIGVFVNTLAIRNFPEGKKTFRTFLNEVRDKALAAYENQEYQFEALVEKVNARRDMGRNPLFDVMLSLQNITVEETKLEGLSIKPYPIKNVTSKFDLTITIKGLDKKPVFEIEYCTRLFKEDTVRRLGKHFINILENASENPELQLSDIEMTDKEEKQQLLWHFNATEAEYPREKTIQGLFEEQAEKAPESIAVVYDKKLLTYRELNEKANRLAWLLRKKGVKPESIVGIMVERSLEMIIGILGIIKAGGAYLPIDPAYPKDRISYMLEDSQSKWLVTQKQLAEDAPFAGTLVLLEEESMAEERTDNPENINKPGDMAYIIYTSGTTGKPKGTVIEHRNVVRLLFNDKMQFDFHNGDVWTLFHSYCFDFSVWEMYGALLYGGKLVIIPKATAQEPKAFLKLLKEEKVTVLNQTPSAFYMLAEAEMECKESALALRYVIFGGEALKPNLLKDFQNKYKAVKLINMYGITETTVHVTYKELKPMDIISGVNNIGRPIPTLSVYIMDSRMKLLPVGIAGELCVGGDGLARGYLKRPELTAEKFVQNPYKKNERIYRSGDLARMLPDGDIEYLGRIDQQVKIRGHRIELGEIESCLLMHEAIKEAVVTAKEDEHGSKYLCAYIVSDTKLTAEVLRAHLAKALPDYMIPSCFVPLAKLPLNQNGKIDRKALPEPESRYETGTVYEAARNEPEERLVSVWQEVLKTGQIGIRDNFFALGGDSIKAIQVASRMQKYGYRLHVKDLLKNPTISQLSKYVKQDSIMPEQGYELTPSDTSTEELEALMRVFLKNNGMYKAKDIEDIYPLTAMQEGMLFHSITEKKSKAYFEQVILKIEGEMDITLCERSLNRIIERYGVLRTVFMYEEVKSPVQLVLKERKADICCQDLTGMAEQEKADYMERFLEADREKGFDVTKDMLIRLSVIKVNDGSYRMIWSFHHIIMDGWCLGIIMHDFAKTYEALRNQRSLKLPPVYPYSRFIRWLKNQDKEAAGNYWAHYLEGYENPAGVPRTNRRQTGYSKEDVLLILGEDLTSKISDLSIKMQVTVSTLFRAVWGIILRHYNSSEEVVFGAVVSGRPTEVTGIENMLGLFINTVPVRVKAGSKEAFSEVIRRIQENAAESKAYEYYPLNEIQGNTVLKQNLFDHIIVFENYPVREEMDRLSGNESLGFVITDVSVNEQTNYDFNIIVTPGKSLNIHFNYNGNVYSRAFIESIGRHIENVMRQIALNPEIKVEEIEVLEKQEKELLLCSFNATAADYPREKTVSRLFEEQVERTPESIAVIYGEKRLTYSELNEKANQLARLLRLKGVKPDSIVGLMAGRSLEMLIGILGILKAGGAYMPIGTDYPKNRISYILKDSGSRLVLTCKALEDRLSFDGEIINLDDPELYRGEGHDIINTNTPNNLAYIIYTSGSTGKPKGVMIEHCSLVNRINWMQKKYPIGESDVILQKTPYTFDVSVWELLWWSVTGASVCMLEAGGEKDPGIICEAIEANKVTTIHFVPSMLSIFLEYVGNLEDKSAIRCLKRVFSSGEALTVPQVKRFKELLGLEYGISLINLYGPTEATIDVSYYDCTETDIEDSIPIGKPIDNTVLYVLQKDGKKLQPIGIPGELCIGGDGLARGYLKRPELTALKFVENPFIKGQRMYKTGDLARWLPDGNIEFLGRIDQQVKIRGHRIELGEIESCLLMHEAIREAVVTAKEDEHGSEYLCAYIVSDTKLTAEVLRAHLAKTLPDYMVPSYFVPLAKLPLNQNGKIDRKALPEPESRYETGTVYEAARNETEERLVSVWQEVLKTDRIGIRDNFFALGGDSIKAIQAASRAQKYGYKVQVKDLLKNPTIAELSKCVEGGSIKPEQRPVTGEVPLLPIQHWFFEQTFEEKNYWNQAVMLYSKDGFEEDILRKVFRSIIEHHDQLRSIYEEKDGRIVQRIRGTDGELFTLKSYDLRGEEDSEKIKESAEALQKSMDLQNGPLVKLGLFKTARGDHLLIAVHHLVIDGVSWRILFEDLDVGYRQAKAGLPVELQAKTASYREWANALKNYGAGRKLEKEVEYWHRVEQTEIVSLRSKRGTAESCGGGRRTEKLTLTEAETEKLLKGVNSAYNTEINDILLTALGMAVNGWTGCGKIAVNLEGHGREEISDIDVTRTVGWFTTMYPVVLDMSAGEIGSKIKQVKETLREIPNKGIGYGILKYLSVPELRNRVEWKLKPEISFNYLGQFDSDVNAEVFEASNWSAGASVSEAWESPHTIDINGMIAGRRLGIEFSYDSRKNDGASIKELAENYYKALKNIMEHCLTKQESELTPSDTGIGKTSIEEFEALIKAFLKNNGMYKAKDIEDIYPLTAMQEGMLLYSITDRQSTAYFEQTVLEVDGQIDIGLFEHSLNKIIERHTVLRTVFMYEEVKNPVQLVLKERKAEICYQDLEGMAEQEKAGYIEKFLEEDRKKGFDVTKDVLIRLSVIKVNDGSYRVVWSIHHIIMDGWCLGIIMKEFVRVYHALRHGRRIKLPDAYPYGRYIKWLKEQEKETAANYWKSCLEGYETLASVPRTNSGQTGYSREEVLLYLEKGLTSQISDLSNKLQVTVNTLFQAVWGIILERYSNSQDVVFGAVVSGRSPEVEEVENMLGLFINTVPVRIRTEWDEKFSSVAQRLQENAAESKAYEYYSLAEIQGETALGKNLLDHIMIFENYPIEEELMKSTADDMMEFSIGKVRTFEQTNYNLNIAVVPGKQIRIQLNYNGKVYERAFIENIGKHIKHVFRQVVADPDIALKKIELLAEVDKLQLLQDFNRTAAFYPREKTIKGLFEEIAEKTPDNIAVVFKNQSLTYGALNYKANRLAYILREKGVRPDSIVGIMAERSMDMVIGILGILKAGGAYLPIDPDYPEDRIEYILEDSGAKLLLTHRASGGKVKKQIEQLKLDEEDMYAGNGENPDDTVHSGNLAYIIYTSGSTGKPKGVMLEHRGVANLMEYFRQQIGVTAEDRILQFANITFDASLSELVMSLLLGGVLYIPAKEDIYDPSSLAEYMNKNGITVATFPPPYLARMKPDAVKTLRILMTAGSETAWGLVDLWKDKVEYINAYGPTEATVCTTFYRCRNKTGSLVPIGKPIINNKVYILDAMQNVQPVGIPGELHIGGAGLARGYLNNPNLTAEKFIENPFAGGERMYKTGDLAKWLPDGNIEFLGRIDRQVKIRGYRIELGEIESRLMQHEAVSDAVVEAYEDKNGHKYLCAYIVTEKPLTTSELYKHIAKELPDYMQPSTYVELKKMPLNQSGKIDRKALPEPHGNMLRGTEFEAPRNEIEKNLVDIWKEVLKLDKISIWDNFFELGGNSLLLLRVHSKIKELYPESFEISDFFAYPCISKLSDLIAGKYNKTDKIIRLETVTLTKDFFKESVRDGKTAALKVKTGDMDEKLNRLSKTYALPKEQILKALLLYLLYEFSGENVIVIHSLKDESGTVFPVKLDFSAVEALPDLFGKLGHTEEDCLLPKSYLLQDAVRVVHEKNKYSAAVLFMGNMSIRLPVINTYDIVMKTAGSHIGSVDEIVFEYNASRLEEKKMEQMAKAYAVLIGIASAYGEEKNIEETV